MEKYEIKGSPKTPTIIFDLVTGNLEISGRSIPENSIDFYRPLIDALDKYSTIAKPATNVNIMLEYLNTASSKCILDVFRKLETIHKAGSAVIVNWHYEDDDDEMLEAGEEYSFSVGVPFKMVPVTK